MHPNHSQFPLFPPYSLTIRGLCLVRIKVIMRRSTHPTTRRREQGHDDDITGQTPAPFPLSRTYGILYPSPARGAIWGPNFSVAKRDIGGGSAEKKWGAQGGKEIGRGVVESGREVGLKTVENRYRTNEKRGLKMSPFGDSLNRSHNCLKMVPKLIMRPRFLQYQNQSHNS